LVELDVVIAHGGRPFGLRRYCNIYCLHLFQSSNIDDMISSIIAKTICTGKPAELTLTVQDYSTTTMTTSNGRKITQPTGNHNTAIHTTALSH